MYANATAICLLCRYIANKNGSTYNQICKISFKKPFDEEEIMRKPAKMILAASAVAVLLGSITLIPARIASAQDLVAEGKKIAENRKKGNCFTCHAYEGANLPGNIGPPLVAMKARFPDKQKLIDQISDATKANPNSVMPPFGKYEILTKKEIEAVAAWVYTL
jgi:sulfur-oxidizing protein SoxX